MVNVAPIQCNNAERGVLYRKNEIRIRCQEKLFNFLIRFMVTYDRG